MAFILYKISNTINNKLYIGQTITGLAKRWGQHKASCIRRKRSKLYNAMRKYGIDKFKIEEICRVENIEELNKIEKETIEKFDTVYNGYNITFGGLNYTRICKNGLTGEGNEAVKYLKKCDIFEQCVILTRVLFVVCLKYNLNNKDLDKEPSEEIKTMIDSYWRRFKKESFEYKRHHLLNLLDIITEANINDSVNRLEYNG